MKLWLKMGSLFLAVLCITSSVSAQGGLADSNWPMFQHDPRHTGQSSFVGITSKPFVVKIFDLQCGSGGFATGITESSNGVVYIATCGGTLYAVNPENWDILWTVYIQGSGYSTPAVASNGDIFWGNSDTFAEIYPNGIVKRIWSPLDYNFVFGSSPVIADDGSVYFTHDAAVSISPDGPIKWVYPFDWWEHASPAIGSDGTIYISGSPEGLYAFKPNGEIKWTCFIGHQGNSPTIGSDGTIYIGGYPSTLYAYESTDTGCVEKWHYTTVESQNIDSSISQPPALGTDGTIYFGTAGQGPTHVDSAIYAVNPDGSLKWRFPTHWRDVYPSGVLSPLTVDKNNNVFGCSDNGYCYGIAPDGTLLWETLVDSSYYLRSAPFIYADGKMMVIGTKGLYRFSVITDEIYLPLIVQSAAQ